jgi:zinc transporter
MLDGRGGCEDLGWAGIESWQPDQGVLWIHLERDEPIAQKWMRERSGIDPLIVEALLAEESRPRVEASEDGLLVVLRGVNVQEQGAPVGLVPIHLWVDAYRVISLRDKNHLLMALRDIREALTIGRGALGSGQLFALIAALLLPPSLFAGMLVPTFGVS